RQLPCPPRCLASAHFFFAPRTTACHDFLFPGSGGGGSVTVMAVEKKLRVATWNCFGAPVTIDGFFSGKPFWPERLEARKVIETLGSFDVVCIQENFVERVRSSLERVRDEAGFTDLWFDPMGPDLDDGTFSGGGLAILSRWPLSASFLRL